MKKTHDHLQKAYEDVPYPGVSDSWSHIRCLEALARLHGLQSADVTACRVLELGCASGRNSLGQAAEYPNSHFVGVDFAAEQIDAGRSVVEQLSMGNIELRHARIEEIDASWGQFDYILCPGVFSWVPAETRQQILSICRENLAPQGVAAVSYNAYPGWHFRSVVRDLMRYHVASVPERQQQISEARSVLGFVADHCAAESLQGRLIRRERDYLRTAGDYYLFHDYLVEENCPLYFHEFVARADEAELGFLCDADYSKMSGAFTSVEVQKVIANTPLVQRCQLLDYLRNESFHCSLLCHKQADVQYTWDATSIEPFYIALADKPSCPEIDLADDTAIQLKFPQGNITVHHSLGKAAIKHLIDIYPAAISFDRLRDTISDSSVTGQSAEQAASLAGAMLAVFRAGLLRLYLHPPAFRGEVSEYPRATPLNRLWASRGAVLTNALHENVILDQWQSFLLARLDGSRNGAALYDETLQATQSGALLDASGRGMTISDVDAALAEFRKRLLLVE